MSPSNDLMALLEPSSEDHIEEICRPFSRVVAVAQQMIIHKSNRFSRFELSRKQND